MAKTKTLRIRFPGWKNYQLDARLEYPEDKTSIRAFAIISHCFTCTKDTLAAFRVSRYLSELGYAVLRFDFAGLPMFESHEFFSHTFKRLSNGI